MSKPDITIQTKVGEILDHYPELEDVLLSMSPAFVKLKNPILRKTVAKFASLKQAAEIGNVDLSVMIRTLRQAAGLTLSAVDDQNSEALKEPKPEWVNIESVSVVFNACPIIDGGGSPMQEILSKAGSLEKGQILKLQTPFVPAPIIDILKGKKYQCWSTKNGDVVETYITAK